MSRSLHHCAWSRVATSCVLAFSSPLTACAQPVNIKPAPIFTTDRCRLIDKKIGYQVTAVQRALQTTTPGGGGDKISYYLYRDLEPGLFDTLAPVFSTVYVVPESGANEVCVGPAR